MPHLKQRWRLHTHIDIVQRGVRIGANSLSTLSSGQILQICPRRQRVDNATVGRRSRQAIRKIRRQSSLTLGCSVPSHYCRVSLRQGLSTPGALFLSEIRITACIFPLERIPPGYKPSALSTFRRFAQTVRHRRVPMLVQALPDARTTGYEEQAAPS